MDFYGPAEAVPFRCGGVDVVASPSVRPSAERSPLLTRELVRSEVPGGGTCLWTKVLAYYLNGLGVAHAGKRHL
jgi:hypothetical protein